MRACATAHTHIHTRVVLSMLSGLWLWFSPSALDLCINSAPALLRSLFCSQTCAPLLFPLSGLLLQSRLSVTATAKLWRFGESTRMVSDPQINATRALGAPHCLADTGSFSYASMSRVPRQPRSQSIERCPREFFISGELALNCVLVNDVGVGHGAR